MVGGERDEKHEIRDSQMMGDELVSKRMNTGKYMNETDKGRLAFLANEYICENKQLATM